jgi:hypothetical protein
MTIILPLIILLAKKIENLMKNGFVIFVSSTVLLAIMIRVYTAYSINLDISEQDS